MVYFVLPLGSKYSVREKSEEDTVREYSEGDTVRKKQRGRQSDREQRERHCEEETFFSVQQCTQCAVSEDNFQFTSKNTVLTLCHVPFQMSDMTHSHL